MYMIIKFYFYKKADRSMPEIVSFRARENRFLVIGQSPQNLLKNAMIFVNYDVIVYNYDSYDTQSDYKLYDPSYES